MDDIKAYTRELKALQRDYLNILPERLNNISTLHQSLIEGSGTTETLNNFIFEIHKLAGSAAMFGLENVSKAARGMEILMTDFDGDPESLSSSLVSELEKLFQTLRESVPGED